MTERAFFHLLDANGRRTIPIARSNIVATLSSHPYVKYAPQLPDVQDMESTFLTQFEFQRQWNSRGVEGMHSSAEDNSLDDIKIATNVSNAPAINVTVCSPNAAIHPSREPKKLFKSKGDSFNPRRSDSQRADPFEQPSTIVSRV